MLRSVRLALAFFPAAFLSTVAVSPVRAAELFDGKQITVAIGYSAGGGFDAFGRLVARYYGNHLPGKPTVIVQNVPAAGSLVLANNIYNVAPKDGTYIGLVAPTLALDQVLGEPGIKFDFPKFNLIGRIGTSGSTIIAWHESPSKSIADAKKAVAVAAATGPSSESAVVPALLNSFVGTKFRTVRGYAGTAETVLALERGEAGYTTVNVSSLTSQFSSLVEAKKLHVLAQNSLERDPAFPDKPTFIELADDAENKKVLGLFAIGADIGRAFIAPPGIEAERVAALRKGFMATMNDPELLAAAKKSKFDLAPLDGEALQKMVDRLANIPPALIEKAKTARKAATAAN